MPASSLQAGPAWWRQDLRLPHLRSTGAWTVLGLFGLVAFMLRPAIFEGRILFERDINLVWWAQVESFVRSIGSGSWPVWDAYRSFGQPLLADPSAEILYPPTWLNLLMPSWAYYTLFATGHLVLAGIGMSVLARRLGLSAGAAFVAGAVWIASGPLFSLVPLYHHLAGAAWVPWVVWAAMGVVARPGPRRAAGLALVTGAQLLAGSADMVMMAVVVMGLFVLRSILARSDAESGEPRRVLAWTGLGLGLGFGLACPQWMPTAALALGSQRFALTALSRTAWSVHPLSLLETLLPFSWNSLRELSPYVTREVYPQGYWIVSLYLGLPALALVLAGSTFRSRYRNVLLGVLAGALLFALGRHGVFYESITFVLPFLRVMRYPVKAMIVASFAWSLLAGLGWDAVRAGLLDTPAGRRLSRGFLVLAVLLAVVAVLARSGPSAWQILPLLRGVDLSRDADLLGDLGRSLARGAVLSLAAALVLAFHRRLTTWTGVALAGLALADLGANHADLQPMAPRVVFETRPEALKVIGKPAETRLFVYDYSMASMRQFASGSGPTQGYDVARGPAGLTPFEARILGTHEYLNPPTAGRWGYFSSYDLDLLQLYPPGLTRLTELLRDVEGSPLHLRLLQLGGVTDVLALHAAPWWDDLVPVATLRGPFVDPIRIFKVPDTLPRTYAVGQARVVSDPQAQVALASPGFDPRREILLAEGSPLTEAPGFRGSARITAFRPDRVELEAETSGPGFVVLLDTHGAGWRATVDGQPAELLRANLAFRAVRVAAGRHSIEMVYRPPGMLPGLAAGGLSLAVLLGLLARSRNPLSAEVSS
jgi:hypothetical protein